MKESAGYSFMREYGWAILAVIISICILAFFGFFSPKDNGHIDKTSPEYFCMIHGLSFTQDHYFGNMCYLDRDNETLIIRPIIQISKPSMNWSIDKFEWKFIN